jgi:hypothetical protein
MIKSEKKLKDLASLLNNKNSILISKAVEQLREEHPFEGAIGLLTEFYDKSEDHLIKKNIEEFMNDLKDQSVCSEIINEIRKPWKVETTTMLVASCWQSGLNYSDYSIDLAEVFLTGDYVTAIECFTVIEESFSVLTRETKDEIIKLILDNQLSQTEEKRVLILELLSILER